MHSCDPITGEVVDVKDWMASQPSLISKSRPVRGLILKWSGWSLKDDIKTVLWGLHTCGPVLTQTHEVIADVMLPMATSSVSCVSLGPMVLFMNFQWLALPRLCFKQAGSFRFLLSQGSLVLSVEFLLPRVKTHGKTRANTAHSLQLQHMLLTDRWSPSMRTLCSCLSLSSLNP